jgi:hypothetical protein
MAEDDVTLYDIPPGFQTRLLSWLKKQNAVINLATYSGGFEVTVDPGGKFTARTFEDAILDATKSRAAKQINPEFGKRVYAWLFAHGAHMTFGERDGEFTVALSDQYGQGRRTEATDVDFEVALVIAEDEFTLAAGEAEPETRAARTRVMEEEEPETEAAPTRAADTRAAATKFWLGDEERTLVSPGLEPNAHWSRAYVNSLPDSAFLYVEHGGQKDRIGRTHPLSLRHLPFKNRSGRVDRHHLAAARSRLHQGKTEIPAHKKVELYQKADHIWEREFGMAANRAPSDPPPRRRKHEPTVRRMIEVEEARHRREERPFDPEARREHYAKPHHFAVNHGHEDKDVLRHVALDDTGYTLVVWDTHRQDQMGKSILGYAFYEPGEDEPLFEGEDFGASPMDAIDSDETLRGLLGFLTLRPGDTDREYFESYTPRQMEFAESEAEELQMFGMEADSEYEPPPLVDVA